MIDNKTLKGIIEKEIKRVDNHDYIDFKMEVAEAYCKSYNVRKRSVFDAFESALGDYSVMGEPYNELLLVNGIYYVVKTTKRSDFNRIRILKLETADETAARFAFATFGL